MIEQLLTACDVCERNAVVGALRYVMFAEGKLAAFNGVVQFEARTGLADSEQFGVLHEKLAHALRACGDGLEISATEHFLRLKNGPFTVRVRKVPSPPALEPIITPKFMKPGAELLAGLKRVIPFMSSDASRPWSVSLLIRGGYLWATNNLALARTPVPYDGEIRIPGPAAEFLCTLPTVDCFGLDDQSRIVFACGDARIRCPQSAPQWPDLAKYFEAMPAALPEIPREMKDAARKVARFSERFVSVSDSMVSSKEAAMETEYEIAFEKAKGTYSAKLLALVLEHATHADFSFYPAPVFFKGEQIEGTAVGMRSA